MSNNSFICHCHAGVCNKQCTFDMRSKVHWWRMLVSQM